VDIPKSPRTRDPRAVSRAHASDADELRPVTIDAPRPGEEAQNRVRKVRGAQGPADGNGGPPRVKA